IQRSDDGTTFDPLATSDSSAMYDDIENIVENKMYWYRLCTIGQGGISTPSIAVQACAATTLAGLSATLEARGIGLSWSAVPVVTAFTVERAQDVGDFEPLIQLDPNSTGMPDSDLTQGQTYRYRITAPETGGTRVFTATG